MTTVRLEGAERTPLPVSLRDIVDVLAETTVSTWALLDFYGRGNSNVSFPNGRTYAEFETAVATGGVTLTSEELRQLANGSADIYEMLMVGTYGETVERPVMSDAEKRFASLADRYPIVVECVDSGYWLVHTADASDQDALLRHFVDRSEVMTKEVVPGSN